MTLFSDTAEFARLLRTSTDEFRRHETIIREQYVRAGADAEPPKKLLERATRRYLIDSLLRALDWNPDNPSQVAEEARATSPTDDRLYFDYLGLAPRTRAPVFLLEAKGLDVTMPRKPRGPQLDAQGMAALIAAAVDALKRGDKSLPIISEWAEFLRDIHAYISSLDELGRATLRRAAITAGGWIIVFREPVATFCQPGDAKTEHIICFTSLDEMVLRHAELYKLLHRSRLVDTLPLTLTVSEALKMISATHVGDCFRAVLVATTTTSGAHRQPYPTRSVYPALLVRTGDRWFAILDYDRPIEEPKRTDRIKAFLDELEQNGTSLVKRLSERFGLPFSPRPVQDFPGFRRPAADRSILSAASEPVAGSAADHGKAGKPEARSFISHSGETGALAEYIVVTGTAWFYKTDYPDGPECAYHFWKSARADKVTAGELHTGFVADSFTEDGQDRHCAHGDLLGLRWDRCQIRAIETHLCCRGCIFTFDCWSTGKNQLPCSKGSATGVLRHH